LNVKRRLHSVSGACSNIAVDLQFTGKKLAGPSVFATLLKVSWHPASGPVFLTLQNEGHDMFWPESLLYYGF
jgi:hypothetical protein